MSLLTRLLTGRKSVEMEAAHAAAPLEVRGFGRGHGTARSTIFSACANPACQTGWLHPLRSRSRPVVEGQWTCSARCTEDLLADAVVRELGGLQQARAAHRPRIPIGLALVEQGWLSAEQLRAGLETQRQTGGGRLGSVLLKRNVVNEELLARARGLQWSCPVLELNDYDPVRMAAVLPRLLVDAYRVLPVRFGGKSLLYLAFEESPDPTIALALERMTGLRVECGIITDGQFRIAHENLLKAEFPPVTLIEAASPSAAAHVLAREIERQQPVASWLVRVREFVWLRLWQRPPTIPLPGKGDVEDLVCSIGML